MDFFDDFSFSQLIKPAVNLGVDLLGAQWKGDANREAQQAPAAQQPALAAEQARQFDEEMAYKYAALAKAGSGGDPFAAQKMKLAQDQRRDALFTARRNQALQNRQQQSEAIRNMAKLVQYR